MLSHVFFIFVKFQLPNKEKGKHDETVNRLDCFLTGLQMSVASVYEKPTSSVVTEDSGRRSRLLRLEKRMKKNPDAYTVAEKNDVEDKLAQFVFKDVAAASGYGLVNNDFLYPYGADGPPSTDALVSNILHVLGSDQVTVAPTAIAIILDNASVNKSIFTLRAFGLLLELIPRLMEVHLLFPSVGHTHNSLHAHFGAVSKIMGQHEAICTPHGQLFSYMPCGLFT